MTINAAAAATVDPAIFLNAAILVTKPGAPMALQWIVDTRIHGPELGVFQQEMLGGKGTLTDHEPARGARHGFTELYIDAKDVAAEVVSQLPHRLQAALAAGARKG